MANYDDQSDIEGMAAAAAEKLSQESKRFLMISFILSTISEQITSVCGQDSDISKQLQSAATEQREAASALSQSELTLAEGVRALNLKAKMPVLN